MSGAGILLNRRTALSATNRCSTIFYPYAARPSTPKTQCKLYALRHVANIHLHPPRTFTAAPPHDRKGACYAHLLIAYKKTKTACADGFSSSLPPVGGSRKRVVFLRNYDLDVIGKRFFHDISLPSASRFGFSVGVLPRDPFRSNITSVSTCMVWGNMS